MNVDGKGWKLFTENEFPLCTVSDVHFIFIQIDCIVIENYFRQSFNFAFS